MLMYPETLEGLFNAIEAGSLHEAKKIIETISVDELNSLHKNQHIINFTLNLKMSAKDKFEILEYLADQGAVPVLSQKQNVLVQVAELMGELGHQKESFLLSSIELHPQFNHFYSKSHLQAVRGKKPAADLGGQKDAYDLLPVFYGLLSRQAQNNWFTTEYDYLAMVNKGYYKGINLAWMLMYFQRYEIVCEILQSLTRPQRLSLASVAPQKSTNINWNYNFLNLVALRGNQSCLQLLLHDFGGNLPDQCIVPFTTQISNPSHEFHGYNALVSLIFRKKIDLLPQLIWVVLYRASRAARFNALLSRSENPVDINYGVPLAFELLLRRGYETFFENVENEQSFKRYELLNSGPKNPKHPYFGSSVARILLQTGRYELFFRLIRDFKFLSSEQRCQFLQTIPLREMLVKDKIVFNDLIRDFSAEQCFTLANYLLNDRGLIAFAPTFCLKETMDRWADKFTAEQSYHLLMMQPFSNEEGILASYLYGYEGNQTFKKMAARLSGTQLVDVLTGCQVIHFADEVTHERQSKKTLIISSFFRLDPEFLKTDLGERLSIDELITLQDRMRADWQREGYYLLSKHLALSLCQIVTSRLQDPASDESVTEDLLQKLVSCNEDLHPSDKRHFNKKLSTLIILIIERGLKARFLSVLLRIDRWVYEHIRAFVSDHPSQTENFALEGLAYYLQYVNANEDEMLTFSIRHACMLRGQKKLEDEVKRLRDQLPVEVESISTSPTKITSKLETPKSPGRRAWKNPPTPIGFLASPKKDGLKRQEGETSEKENFIGSPKRFAGTPTSQNAASSPLKFVQLPVKRVLFADAEESANQEPKVCKSATSPLADLFAAIDHKSLDEIISLIHQLARQSVDLNALHEGQHIINYILGRSPLHKKAKEIIKELMGLNAFPILASNDNILIKLALLGSADTGFLQLVVLKIKKIPTWSNFYNPAHLQTLLGEHPASVAETLSPDRFGLLPIHYAFVSKNYNLRWIWNETPYDFMATISNGILQGVNLFWFLAQQFNPAPFIALIKNLSPQKRYVIARTAPSHPSHPLVGQSIAEKFAGFDIVTLKMLLKDFDTVIPAAARYSLLAGKSDKFSVAVKLVEYAVQTKDLTYLDCLQGMEQLAIEQRSVLLNARSTQSICDSMAHSPSIAWHLLLLGRADYVKANARDFSKLDAEDRFNYLSSRQVCPDRLMSYIPLDISHQFSIAGFYIKEKWFDELFALLCDLNRAYDDENRFLDGDQYTEILTSYTRDKSGRLSTVINVLFSEVIIDNKERNYIAKLKMILWSYDSAEKLARLLSKIPTNTHQYHLISEFYFERLVSEFGLLLTCKDKTKKEIFDALDKIIVSSKASLENLRILYKLMGELFNEICKSKYKIFIQEYFLGSPNQICTADGNSIFTAVTEKVPGYGLEGVAMYCQVMGLGGNPRLDDLLAYAGLCKRNDGLRTQIQELTQDSTKRHGDSSVPQSPAKKGRIATPEAAVIPSPTKTDVRLRV